MLKVLSLGWGVQSFTLAAMSVLGEIEKVDFAIYSDTLHEKQATYDFIAEWTQWLEDRGLFIANCDERKDETNRYMKNGFVQIPAFAKNEADQKWVMRRQCTSAWKIEPAHRFLQQERVTDQVELWMGISFDEWERAKDSKVQYITHRYPLIEREISREDCVEWLRAHDLPVPPRSACHFCPYTYIDDWKDMAKNYPEDFKKAIEVDETIRHAHEGSTAYLNRWHIPLVDIEAFEYKPKYAIDSECDSGFCFT